MKDGANVLEDGVPSLDLSRPCRGTLPVWARAPPSEACDWVRAWDVGVDVADNGEPGVKATDFGLPAEAGAGETDAFLENGLLRDCAMLWEVKAIALDGWRPATRSGMDIIAAGALGQRRVRSSFRFRKHQHKES